MATHWCSPIASAAAAIAAPPAGFIHVLERGWSGMQWRQYFARVESVNMPSVGEIVRSPSETVGRPAGSAPIIQPGCLAVCLFRQCSDAAPSHILPLTANTILIGEHPPRAARPPACCH